MNTLRKPLLSNEIDGNIKRYIEKCICTENYDIECTTRKEKFQFVMDTFKSEYVHESNIKRYGSLENIFTEYLMGLPSCINIDYENCKIIKLGFDLGILRPTANENTQDNLILHWFKVMSKRFFIECNKMGVK